MDIVNNTEVNGVPTSASSPEAATFVEDILGLPQIEHMASVINEVQEQVPDTLGVPASAFESTPSEDTEEAEAANMEVVDNTTITDDYGTMHVDDAITDGLEDDIPEVIGDTPSEPTDGTFAEDTNETDSDGVDTSANEDTSTEAETQSQEVEDHSIRPNSATLLVSDVTSRFSGAIWADKIREQTIVLAGVGGIGSYVGFLLSRVRPYRIILYDPDIVEEGNMSGQLYSYADRNNFKARALGNMLRLYSLFYDVYSHTERFYEHSTSSDIMICGFDNMSARRVFFERWMNHVENSEHPENCLFIDGRLAAEEFQIFCIKGDDVYHQNKYRENWLFSDEEAEETICSYKQTSHCANMIASMMVNLLVNFIANQCEPLIDRDVPFFTSYDATTMYLKTES